MAGEMVVSGVRELQTRMLTKDDGALGALIEIGKRLAEGNLGKVKHPSDGFLIACYCHERGVGLVEFLQSHHVVQGRITRAAEYMLFEFTKQGGKIKWLQFDAKAAKAEFTWGDQTITAEMTVEDAAKMVGAARLQDKKDVWYCHTAAMLRARLCSSTFRFLCPQISGGFHTPEELADAGIIEATATNVTATADRRAELEAMAASVATPTNSATVSPSAKEVYEAAVANVAGNGVAQDEIVDAVIEPASTIPFEVDPPKASGEQLQRLAKLGATCGYTMAETCDWVSGITRTEVGNVTQAQLDPLLARLGVLADLVGATSKMTPPYDAAACKSMLAEATTVPDARNIALDVLQAFLKQLTGS